MMVVLWQDIAHKVSGENQHDMAVCYFNVSGIGASAG